MSKRGNGVEKDGGGQTALDLEQENAAAPAADRAADQAVSEGDSSGADSSQSAGAEANPVTELGNSQDGCWKVLASGERVEFSDKEWRKELTRLLASSLPTP